MIDRNKLAATTAVLISLGISAGAAQAAKTDSDVAPQGKAPTRSSQSAIKSLDLSPDQKKKLTAIRKRYSDEMKDLKARREKEILGVLTPQQGAQYRQAMEQARAASRPIGGVSEKPVAMMGDLLPRMKERLGLSSDQESRIAAILKKSNADWIAIRAQHKGDTPEEKRRASVEFQRKVMEQVSTLLTPEQRERMKTATQRLRAGRGPRGGNAPLQN